MSYGQHKFLSYNLMTCEIDMNKVMDELPPEDLVKLQSNCGEIVHVPRVTLKVCGGSLAKFMGDTNTRISIPFGSRVTNTLRAFFTGGKLSPILPTDEWMELFVATRVYEIDALESFLRSDRVVQHLVANTAEAEREDRFKLRAFATTHGIESLRHAIATNDTFQRDLSTYEGTWKATKDLLDSCLCRHGAQFDSSDNDDTGAKSEEKSASF